ncbi:PBSX family phage terminase large subunit [Phenylobacterium sp.]|uniref:PBSX family phage terminase large subunit n=1 Tax=Phenylobacterium sp. TaxID=1871053 RepID=UPI0025DF0461|nr:phage terminase large subunit [Phenylobacterium sp.]MCA6270690.1 PBSX family phage terminase large subunit [Phenylobacterium sp.]
MTTLRIPTARVFQPLLAPSRYKGAWGGRGSGKSHFFAGLALDRCVESPGLRILCVREVQKSLRDSAKRLIEDQIAKFNVRGFEVLDKFIRTPGGGQIDFVGMQDHTAESIKSLEGYDVAWVEEARSLSPTSLRLLRPTIRKPGSELWFSWNPKHKTDPVDALLRGPELPPDAVVVQANWSDNPWFPDELEAERQFDFINAPDQYGHVWNGEYAQVTDGAYYAKSLTQAKAEGRIGNVAADPLMTFRAFWDIGGTGAKADACAIWVCQFIGREIRVLDYYEAQGQPLAAHVNWLREKGYGQALCVLPHDGAQNDKVHAVSYESALREAGFSVDVVPNQGRGAASQRIEAVRRLMPAIWFNALTTEGGREALGHYHEKRDEARGIGLGPEHDWSSHGADAFGLMAVAYEAPVERKPSRTVAHAGGWMS